MTTRRFFGGLRRDQRGSYLVEFALLALPLFTLISGGIEIGYLAYAKARVEGALRQVARAATTGNKNEAQLDALLHSKLDLIVDSTIAIEKRNYTAFGDVGQPEPLVSDAEPLGGTPGTGDCYRDVNGNGTWDEDMGAEGIGGAEDIIYYGVTVRYPMLFSPLAPVFHRPDKQMEIKANAVLKNEPFAEPDTPEPETKCID